MPGVVHFYNVHLADRPEDGSWDYRLTSPVTGGVSESYAILLEGWVVHRESQAHYLEVSVNGRPLKQIPITARQEELAERHPDVEWAADGGFRYAFSSFTLDPYFELEIEVVLLNDERLRIATIRGYRRRFPGRVDPALQPLMLTSLARSGSTWAVALLGQHPNIVAYFPFYYEPRVASYWLEIFTSLCEPASYLQSVRPEVYGDYWWLGTMRLSSHEPHSHDPGLEGWLGYEQVIDVAEFCLGRVEAFYSRTATLPGDGGESKDAVYFTEKFSPASIAQGMLWEARPNARELFLVRDFRDTLCSMKSYAEARGYAFFGGDPGDDEVAPTMADFSRDVTILAGAWQSRSERAHLVRYEDLVLEPRECLTAIMDYLGIETTPKVIRETIDRAEGLAPDKQSEHITSGAAASSIGRWRTDLTPALQQACEEELGPALELFGYPLEGFVAA